jgi:hypothetical protein
MRPRLSSASSEGKRVGLWIRVSTEDQANTGNTVSGETSQASTGHPGPGTSSKGSGFLRATRPVRRPLGPSSASCGRWGVLIRSAVCDNLTISDVLIGSCARERSS